MAVVRYVAHRGLSMEAPENTIPAFELAGQSGFWAIECDTYCTADGRWIVHHDRTVDRMTDGTGRTKDFSFSEIKELTIDSGRDISNYPELKIPALEEVLDVCKKYGMYAFVEIEEYHRDSDIAVLLELVNSRGMLEHCYFICFDAENLKKVRNILPEQNLGYLSSNPPSSSDIASVKNLGRTILDYNFTGVKEDDIRQCHAEGIEVGVWTVNTLEDAQPLIEAGVDYITTDTALNKK